MDQQNETGSLVNKQQKSGSKVGLSRNQMDWQRKSGNQVTQWRKSGNLMYYKIKNGIRVSNRLQSDCLQMYKGGRHMASQRGNISLVDYVTPQK